MRLWIKRTLIGATSVLVVLVCALGAFYYLVLSDLPGLCNNEVFSQVNSPDGKYKALIFQRDCGATTGFSTQVSVLDISEELENEGGNVFITANHPNENKIELHWVDSSNLIIQNTKTTEPSRKEPKIGTVDVRYE